MKVAKVLSKTVVEACILTAFLYGTGLMLDFIYNNHFSYPFMTQKPEVERQS